MKMLSCVNKVINISLRIIFAGLLLIWHLIMTIVGLILTAVTSR